MKIVHSPVKQIIELENHIFLLKIHSPEIANSIKPGQFLNIKVSDNIYPLLRRPFSVCDVEGENIFLMFNIFGEGTKILAHKKIGDDVDILGPLGNGFNFEDDFDTAIIVAGGLGVAPFPFLNRYLKDKEIYSFIGGRSSKDVITYKIINPEISTDDGSLGFRGTVVELLAQNLHRINNRKVKIFACGPNAMLRALRELCLEKNLLCEASTECAMACGFGICQGCPIESSNNPDKYLLVCKDGPVFNISEVII
ncbi:MAG: dihydroorotate dehydrogenase electron transfer subunit [Ignavibacteriaceae bacterium]|nr:dihydroorotate dehydrogenase electron transfer subunit [Ignavibacteriaceae bacterium]